MANLTTWRVHLNFTGGLTLLARRRDVAFGLVLAWALYGVYLARPHEEQLS